MDRAVVPYREVQNLSRNNIVRKRASLSAGEELRVDFKRFGNCGSRLFLCIRTEDIRPLCKVYLFVNAAGKKQVAAVFKPCADFCYFRLKHREVGEAERYFIVISVVYRRVGFFVCDLLVFIEFTREFGFFTRFCRIRVLFLVLCFIRIVGFTRQYNVFDRHPDVQRAEREGDVVREIFVGIVAAVPEHKAPRRV